MQYWTTLLLTSLLVAQISHLSLASNLKLADVKQTNSANVAAGAAFDTDILKWIQSSFARGPEEKQISSMINSEDGYDFNFETHLSTSETLQRLGYQCETHNVTSDDGYVTRLVRIVNPHYIGKANSPRHLPTVVFYAGQGVSPGLFLMGALRASSDQLRPAAHGKNFGEDYFGEPLSNRSLALSLSNSGYDVWLIPARGVDKFNRACAERKQASSGVTRKLGPGDAKHPHPGGQPGDPTLLATLQGASYGPQGRNKRSLVELKPHRVEPVHPDCCRSDYWSFSSDEIVQFEFRHQLELVLSVSRQDKLSLVSYSNGGFISFAFQASADHCDFASRHLDAHVALGPSVFVNKFNLFLGASGLLSHLTPPNWPFVEDHIDALARGGLNNLCKSKLMRYTACKFLLDNYYGHSGQFQTFLELSLLDFINRPSSARAIRQTLQASYSGKLRKYDHGPLINVLTYGVLEPPEYQLAKVGLDRILLVAGGADAIADSTSVGQLRQQLAKQHVGCITVAGYNHLDLVAARDVQQKVNNKVLNYLNERQLQLNFYKEEQDEHHSGQAYGRHLSAGQGSEAETGAGQAGGRGSAEEADSPSSGYVGSDDVYGSSGLGDAFEFELGSGARAMGGGAPIRDIAGQLQTSTEAQAPTQTLATTGAPISSQMQPEDTRPAEFAAGQPRGPRRPTAGARSDISRVASVASTAGLRTTTSRVAVATASPLANELPKLVVANAGPRPQIQRQRQPFESAKSWHPGYASGGQQHEHGSEAATTRMSAGTILGSRPMDASGDPEQIGYIRALSR